MTLILTVNGPETICLLADRRLSFKDRPPKDDARKVMFLETIDGTAILGYAGLGATALGTEPADWMSAVLRGRNLPLEQSLEALAEAMKKQFPRHMVLMPGVPAHHVIVPAFLGNEPRLYTIELVRVPDGKGYAFRCARRVVDKPTLATPGTPRLAMGGTGGVYLFQKKNWMRSLLRVIRASDRGQTSPLAVADHLANLNNEVYLGINDKSVGPRCVVAWRHRKGGVHNGGGGHQFYTGTTRDASVPSLPTIASGTDVAAFASLPHITKMLEALGTGEPLTKVMNKDEIDAELEQLPDKPDEHLR